jgi:hypothetical protein
MRVAAFLGLCFVLNQPVYEQAHQTYQNKQERHWPVEISVRATSYLAFASEPQPDTKKSEPDQQPESWYQYLWSQNASNWALVFVAAFGLWFARRALRANEKAAAAAKTSADAAKESTEVSREQVRILQETSQKELRAYVGVSNAGIIPQGSEKFTAQITFKNFGQTPAYDVHHWIGAWPEEYPLKQPLEEMQSGPNDSKGVLHPGAEPVIGKEVDTYELLFLNPAKKLYIYGKITYKDAFGISRQTTYRYIFPGMGGWGAQTMIVGTFIRLETDSAGNEAT